MSDIADFLVPHMGGLPVSSTRHYQTAAVTRQVSPTLEATPLHGALQLPAPDELLGGLPAEGVLLTHEQAWIIEGLALGPLLHSVSLAPGEITQIAVHSQTEQVAQRSVDAGLQVENLSQTSTASTDVAESEVSGASESASGMSTASTSSSSNQAAAGGIAGLLGVSAGGSSQSAFSSQAAFSTGHRDVSDASNQSLHQAARDQAQLARQAHSVAVREVSESDRVEVTTRVVANYNHMHALTMQYYEVEQVYQLRTRVTDAERLIFLPMKPIDFTDAAQTELAITRYRSELMGAAADLGLHQLVAKLGSTRLDHPLNQTHTVFDEATEGTVELGPAQFLERRISQLTTDVGTADAAVKTAQETFDKKRDAMYTARDALRRLNEAEHRQNVAPEKRADDADETTGMAARAKAQRDLERATAAVEAADAAVTAAKRAAAAVAGQLEQARAEQRMLVEANSMDGAAMRALLHKHATAINQGLWLRLDPSTMSGLFARRTFEGDHLGDMVDPNPVCVAGDLLGFRWRFRDEADDEEFTARHLSSGTLEHSVTVPTGGIFGEAVLGTSVAAERIDLTRFWNWKDSLPPIHPTQISPVSPTAEPTPDAPGAPTVQDSGIDLGAVTFPEVSSTMPALAKLLGDPELFRDMSGQDTTAALAKSAMELTAGSATEAGRLANENFNRFMAFQRSVASSLGEAAEKASQKDLDPTLAGGVLNNRDETAGGHAASPGLGPPVDDDASGTGSGSAGGGATGGAPSGGGATATGTDGTAAGADETTELVAEFLTSDRGIDEVTND